MPHTRPPISLIAPTGASASPCGYCSSTADTSSTIGFWAYELHPSHYQQLMDRGWRRSGKYLYRPCLTETCCPAITIRCPVAEVEVGKGQRRVVGKVRRWVARGAKRKPPKRAKVSTPRDIRDLIIEAEHPPPSTSPTTPTTVNPPLRTELVRAAYDPSTYALFTKYQIAIHKDPPHKLSPEKYRRFLVDTPLTFIPPPLHLSPTSASSSSNFAEFPGFGSFHQKYYTGDNTLIAVAVLDILPQGVSSVYFMYDPDYGFLSLGTYSALREIAMTRAFMERVEGVRYYYMGYYIHSCAKMRYKAQYKPSELLCPATYTYAPLSTALPILEAEKIAPLAPNSATADTAGTGIERLRAIEAAQLASVTDADVEGLMALSDGVLVEFGDTEAYEENREDARMLRAVCGRELMGRMILVT
ncbi:arginine-tRNA-protein transferase [Fimicolochytrium jonesii]|uniref:arginine-tRNA-protein transferase n=1 Tax=Fimicolochytrium jonesii TaxID=1396493 RepID=UPI0022FE96BE|nr:arginine-tRNA-protein transferase [Fimicolochytrium jonesii]KAI8816508.1 arginine-tRNA-protein transferase [Fimicolochytrium jonesii]